MHVPPYQVPPRLVGGLNCVSGESSRLEGVVHDYGALRSSHGSNAFIWQIYDTHSSDDNNQAVPIPVYSPTRCLLLPSLSLFVTRY